LVAMGVFARLDYHLWRRYDKWILAGALLSLVLVLGLGRTVRGARRWLILGPVSVQPSEFVKIALIVYLAGFLNRKSERIREFLNGFLPPVLVIGAAFSLIVLQPDFGTAVLLAATLYVMLFAAGARLWHTLPMGLASLPILVYLVVAVPYRWRRILAFLDPWADRFGAGYHNCQALLALGLGGWARLAPGSSRMKRGFLPEASNDFAFAILGEEFGFVGSAVVILLIAAYVCTAFRLAVRMNEPFGSHLAVGIGALIGLQAIVHVGVVSSVLPPKGIGLPFVSFGGSGLVASAIATGILLNIANHCPDRPQPRCLGAERIGDLA